MRRAYHLALADAQKVLDKQVGVKMVPFLICALKVLEELGVASLDRGVPGAAWVGHFYPLDRQSLPRKLRLCCYSDLHCDSYVAVAVPTVPQMLPSSYLVSVLRRHELRVSLRRTV